MLASGGLALRHATSAGGSTLPATALLSAGSLSVLGGAGLCWSAASVDPMPPKWLGMLRPIDLVAGVDPKRGSDLGFRLPLWRVAF